MSHEIHKILPLSQGFPLQPGKQDFYKLRDEHLKAGTLFEDPEFLADDSTLYYSDERLRDNTHFEWKRPSEIVRSGEPKFFSGGFSRFDIKQGELGDCWFLAASATLAQDKILFRRVVPGDNTFDKETYAGIFHFKFWHFGAWVDIVIDDRLPVIFGNQLVYMKSSETNEFWSALLEKAYAKLYGTYKALDGGKSSEALVDFTGGLIEKYSLSTVPSNFYQILEKSFARHALICVSVRNVPGLREPITPQGLVCGHAYSVTKTKVIDFKGQKVQLLEIRNPWGNATEWKGAWSDKSPEWNSVPEATKKEMGYTVSQDGEFWISYPDFCKYFNEIEICNMSPDTSHEGQKWVTTVFDGEWVPKISAGGCWNNRDTSFEWNPQYVVTVNSADEDHPDGKCTIVISLMQKFRRFLRNMGIVNNLSIGFAVFKITKEQMENKPLKKDFFRRFSAPVYDTEIIDSREVSKRFEVDPGHYLIIPSTFNADLKGKFLVRVFTESAHTFEEHDEKIDIVEVPPKPNKLEINIQYDPKSMFNQFAGKNHEIEWAQWQKLIDNELKNVKDHKGFSKHACRSMVAMFDLNQSGGLNIDQFRQIYEDSMIWKAIFEFVAVDNKLNVLQLRDALGLYGCKLNNKILNALVHRYGSDDGTVDFDDFLMCALKVKSSLDKFKTKAVGDKATYNADEFVSSVVYS